MLLSPDEPLMILAEMLQVEETATPVKEVCHDYHERGFDVSDELRQK